MTSRFPALSCVAWWLALAETTLCGITAVVTSGCDPECGEPQTIRYDCEECGITDEAGTFYQSTPITGPLLHFPPQRTYELVHRLRGVPSEVDISLSFQERGSPDRPLKLSPGTGKESEYSVNPDAGTITVTNDTCAEFYVYVTASAITTPAPGADGGE